MTTGSLRAVIVAYNAGPLLDRAVESVEAAEWDGPRHVVVIDNASTDGSVERLDGRAGLTVIRNDDNRGFGANNQGLADLIGATSEPELPPADVVLLLNPDAAVGPGALTRLAAALDNERRVGAAAPHIVFDRSYVEVSVAGAAVEISGARADGVDVAAGGVPVNAAIRLPGPAGPIWQIEAGGAVRFPQGVSGVELTVDASGPAAINGIAVSGSDLIEVAGPRLTLVQNTGNEIDGLGVGSNRGFGDVDGSIDYPSSVPAWCGAAVLLSAEYVRAVGAFDERLFLYYEDMELARRGAEQGWLTEYVASARVVHRHSDATGQGSRLVEVLQQRNRLVTLARHGDAGTVAEAYARAALTPLSLAASALRDRGQARARLRLAGWRARSFGEALVRLPAARRDRRADQAGANAAFMA